LENFKLSNIIRLKLFSILGNKLNNRLELINNKVITLNKQNEYILYMINSNFCNN